MATMKTQTEYDYNNLLELQRVASTYLTAKQTVRKKAFSLGLGNCCLGVGMLMMARGHNGILAPVLLIAGMLFLIRYVFLYQLMAWSAAKNIKPDQRVNEFFFEEQHILAQQKQNRAQYPYEKCCNLLETEKHFYFIMDDGQGLLLDKANLKGGSVDQLRTFLESKCGTKTTKAKVK